MISLSERLDQYVADPKIKEDAMERTRPVDVPPGRYQPEEQVLAFLESL